MVSVLSLLIAGNTFATTDIIENFGIPSLGGNFNVGVKSTTIIEPLTLRPLTLYFFYPSQTSSKSVTLESFGSITSERIKGWKEIFAPIENIDLAWTINFLNEIHKNGKLNAKASSLPIEAQFPILIFQPGATGSTQDYAFLLEQFASYGIIILSIDRPIAEGIDKFYYLPDNKKYIKYDAIADQEKYGYLFYDGQYSAILNTQVIEHLLEITSSQHLDFDQKKIFISGHSLGGHGAFRSSARAANVKGYINFDGSVDSTMEADFDFNKNFYSLEFNCASCDLINRPVIDKVLSEKMHNLFITVKQEGFDHGSVGNNPIYVENSPKGKGFSLSSDYRGELKKSDIIYREVSEWLMRTVYH
jgi:hypothetical protein